MERIVTRRLPDGTLCRVSPFHVCIKGLEDAVLCRDYEDYDVFVKILCVSAWRTNVIIITYSVVSNHCHSAVLAKNQVSAEAFIYDVKKVYSMWFCRKYGEKNILHRIDAKALLLDTDWYVRNALAYIPRNALDNGCNINEYPWSGYRACFCRHNHQYDSLSVKPVALLTKRERKAIMHTDTEMFKIAEEVSQRWFKNGVRDISKDQRVRLILYLYRSNKTTVAQLARVLGLSRDLIQRLLSQKEGR